MELKKYSKGRTYHVASKNKHRLEKSCLDRHPGNVRVSHMFSFLCMSQTAGVVLCLRRTSHQKQRSFVKTMRRRATWGLWVTRTRILVPSHETKVTRKKICTLR